MGKIPLQNFNTGEVSPLLYHRSDLNKYRSSAQRLENFLNTPQGAIKRRLGTDVKARIGDTGLGGVRVIPWEIDRSQHFQMVFVGTDIYIYSDQGVLVDTITSIPWAEEDFGELYFKQVFDIMFIAHFNYPLKKISRVSTFEWEVTNYDLKGGPYDDVNPTTSNVMTYTTGPDTLATVDDTFVASDVGRKVKILNTETITLGGSFSSSTQSASIPISGEVRFKTEGGTWTGEAHLELSTDGGTKWETIANIRSQGNTNRELTRDVSEFNALVRVRLDYTSGTMIWTLESEEQSFTHFNIDTFVDEKTVRVSAENQAPTTGYSTHIWSLGVFSETNGYPGCVEIYEERLMLAGVPSSGATVYGSTINDWNNWQSGTLATSPIQFTLASDIRNRIRWMMPEQQLILGTDYGEWSIGGRDSNEALSGSNVNAKRQTQFGSDPVQPIIFADMSLYIEAGGKRMRAAQYNYEKDGYIANNMTILAEHLTNEYSSSFPNGYNIIRLAYSRTPDSVVWAVRDDGLLLSFTYEREHQVSAWSRQPFSDDGKVLDINSVLASNGDVVTMLVERSDGTYLETINQGNLCLDWQQNYSGILESDVLALPGDEAYIYLDEDLTEKTIPFEGTGSFVFIDAVVADLVLKYDGTQLVLGTDYTEAGTDFYWIPSAIDGSLVTAFDFTSALDPADYDVHEFDECFIIDVKGSSYTLADLTVKRSASTVATEEKWVMTGDRQILVTNCSANVAADITIEDTGTPLDVDEYVVRRPRKLISIYGSPQSEIYIGIIVDSIYKPVDPFNIVESGGPGTRNRISEIEVYVNDSIGGEVSGNNGNDYEALKYIYSANDMSSPLQYFSGVVEASINHGSQTSGQFILRNRTPHKMTVTSLAFKGKRLSD